MVHRYVPLLFVMYIYVALCLDAESPSTVPMHCVQNDRVRVSLDLENWTARFFLNGKKVKDGGDVSLEPNQSYHPMICFGGSCRYLLHNPPRDEPQSE